MATTGVFAPLDVSATLNYYTAIDTAEPPYAYVGMEPPAGRLVANGEKNPQQIVVADVRGREEEFSLDKNGFQFMHWPSVEQEFDDKERIQKQYYSEVEESLKQITGARRVFIIGHTIRSPLGREHPDPTTGLMAPVEHIHVDFTVEESVRKVNDYLPDEADRLLKGRVRIVSFWRPIRHAVAHQPLALLDWHHLNEADLVSMHVIQVHHTTYSYGVRYNPAHRWCYLSGQTPDEITIIKIYDSEVDKARCSPHTAFADATSPKEAPERESIEVRAILFDME